MGLVLLGLAPRCRAWLERLPAVPARSRIVWFAASLAVPLVAMVALRAAAPAYAHQVLTREWGLVEPAQFALYLGAAWLAFARAGRHPRAAPEARFFRLAGWVCVVLALEEIDDLGVVSTTARLLGVPRGRIGGVYVGGLHDLLNLASRYSAVLPAIVAGLAAVATAGWVVARGLGRVLAREAGSATSLPLVGALLFMTLAQLTDIDDRPAAPLTDPVLARTRVVGNLREEPLELLAVICLDAALALKLAARLDKPHRAG